FRFNDPGDPGIPENTETQYQPNLHAGVSLELRRGSFLSASVENIIKPTFSFGTTANNSIERNYYFMAGTERILSRNITLRPYLLTRSDLSSYSIEVSAIVEHRGKMWGGASYRSSESVTFLLGYSFLNQSRLRIGYSFDYVVGNTDAKETTSHEVYLRYNLPNLIFAGKKIVKTPRFSF
ncbi:MAG: PorP/SprF family type IX secretion system membrane protein, partial [Ekhidna sp.]|nr:PorP/SprF family type IX secretion system membrane protein [Ekhidna sp.]